MTAARRILADVSLIHGLRVSTLLGPDQHRHVCRARHEAMWRMRNELRLSLPAIGRELGGLHHTTVLHGRSDLAAERVASADAARALEVATAERDKYKMEFIRVGLEKAAADKPGVEMIRLLKAVELGKEEGRKESARAMEVARKALEEAAKVPCTSGLCRLPRLDACRSSSCIAFHALATLRIMAGEKGGAK